MAETEFRDLERIKLLNALRTALGTDVIPSTTAWACLWLSDIDRLRERVRLAQMDPLPVLATFRDMEHSVRLVQKCALQT
jgi:hypothetical protein